MSTPTSQRGVGAVRQSGPTFDTHLAANPDVDAAHIDPLEHFLLFGAIEGRAAIAGGWL